MAVKTLEELSERAQTLYKRANETITRQNYGYAIELLSQILELEPAYLDGRKLLRSVQVRQFESQGMLAKKMAGVSALTGAMRAQSSLKKNPTQALIDA